MNCYLIDLDGTLYRGDQPIEHAAAFVRWLTRTGAAYQLLTNCPQKTPAALAEKLLRLGIAVDPARILTSGLACAEYLRQTRPGQRVFALGSPALKDALTGAGLRLVEEDAEVVVVGFDTDFCYYDLDLACANIAAGAAYIATNLDSVIPHGARLAPHTGAIAAAVSCATGEKPLVIGKPEPFMLSCALARMNQRSQPCVMLGDRLDTDWQFAVQNNIRGYLLLTGVTSRQEALAHGVPPERIAKNLLEVIEREEGALYVD